jgi:hypothetical protein
MAPIDELQKRIPERYQEIAKWVRELCQDPTRSTVLLSMMWAIAAEHSSFRTFWGVASEARQQIEQAAREKGKIIQ